MQIGGYPFPRKVFLAPMAGITDLPFRRLCMQHGAGLTFSEMLSTNPEVWHTDKSRLRLAHHADLGVNAVQIAGSDPTEMAEAAKINVGYGAQLIDINMGCPAKKVNRKSAGSALLREPERVEQILAAVVKAVDVPVTLKMRTGWDPTSRNCVEIAKIAEAVGIQALTLHGRTRACLFNGEAEYDSIKAVKAAVSIPVIANGDITCGQKARDVLGYTGADAIMVGRASLGNPWIFTELNRALGCHEAMMPSRATQCNDVFSHIRALHDFYGEQRGYRIARKHVGWYFDHFGTPPEFKRSFNALDSACAQLNALEDYLNLIQSNHTIGQEKC